MPARPAVALIQKGKGTTGVLWNQVWSFEDSSEPDGINNTFVQPFLAYSLGKGLTFNANIQASYDWNTRAVECAAQRRLLQGLQGRHASR